MDGVSPGALRQAPQRPRRPLPPCCQSGISVAGIGQGPVPLYLAESGPLLPLGPLTLARGGCPPASRPAENVHQPPAVGATAAGRRVCRSTVDASGRPTDAPAAAPHPRGQGRAPERGNSDGLPWGHRVALTKYSTGINVFGNGWAPAWWAGPGGDTASFCGRSDEGVAQGSVPLVFWRDCREGLGAGAPPE